MRHISKSKQQYLKKISALDRGPESKDNLNQTQNFSVGPLHNTQNSLVMRHSLLDVRAVMNLQSKEKEDIQFSKNGNRVWIDP